MAPDCFAETACTSVRNGRNGNLIDCGIDFGI